MSNKLGTTTSSSCLLPPCCAWACISTGEIGVRQSYGEYKGTVEPGLSSYNCCTESITPVSLATQQMQCRSDCKTKDNVTVEVATAIQYHVEKEQVKVALFDVANPKQQIQACVDDVLRSTLPTLDLDEAYASKEILVAQIQAKVKEAMQPFGFHISNVLLTDLKPETSVLTAMNQINTEKRLRQAAIEKAESDKFVLIKKAEAEAESTYLSGIGLARMRTAIADGYKGSITKIGDDVGLPSKDIVHMILMTQYLDNMDSFAKNTSSSILLPHGPGVVADIEKQVSAGFSGQPAMTSRTISNSGSAPVLEPIMR